MKIYIKKIKEWFEATDLENYSDVPPYGQYVASIIYKTRVERVFFIVLFSMLFCSLFYINGIKNAALEKVDRKEYFLLPATIPNIISVRANSLSDEIVYEFAEYFAREVSNVSYDDVETRFSNLEKYLSPEFKVIFRRIYKNKIQLWRERRIDQRFTFDKIDRFERKTKKLSSNKSVSVTIYSVHVWGTVRKYVDGKEMEPGSERLTIEFKTAPIVGDKSWIFEVVNFKRETQEEIDQKKLLSKMEIK